MSICFPGKSALTLAILAAAPASVLASSFQLLEQSPAHLGKAFAGTGSDITDASAVYFNPAGMSQLDRPFITLAGNLVMTEADFKDHGSNTNGALSSTKETGFIPNFYYVQPLTDRWTMGFGANGPFGLASRYDDDWMGRYLATHSELEVANVNLNFAFDVNERFAIALGINYQRADVTLESQVDSTFGINPNPATDSSAKIEGDDDDIVADVSMFYQPTDSTNLGLVWRQGGEFNLKGDAEFGLNAAACSPGAGYPTGAPPAPTTGSICAASLTALTGDAAAQVELPDTVTLSVTHALNDQWALHGDIAWTEWSTIQTIDVMNTGNNATITELDLQYDDTMRYALGVTFKPGGAWTWRAGIALDEAPQKNAHLVNPRIPDEDRTWLSLGFNYEFGNNMSVDVGYAHLWVDDASIRNIDTQTGNTVHGEFNSKVDIVGLQANWWF